MRGLTMDLIKFKNDKNIAPEGRLFVDTDDLSQEEKQKFWSEAEKMTGISFYEGHVEHGYSLKFVSNPHRCPRCHEKTEKHYGNFIYATQIAARVMFAPAGYFCTKCPSVIIDEDMIKLGVKSGFRFQGVVGLDYGKTMKEPDFFRTWNGQKTVYIFDEYKQIVALQRCL